ncbi:MAG: phosphatase PAP2 family protein [Actinomycetota bacterium]|nr:phosphatase PAP2 family protein [Actinomycetota bacterium]
MQPLDRRDRRRALVLTVAAAAVVLVLAARIHRGGGAPLWLDIQGERVAFGHVLGVPLVPDRAARLVVSLGDTPVFAALVGAVIVVALSLRDRISAVVALVACPLALLAVEVIGKPVIGRREGVGYGFPSGHSTAIATFVALVALLAYRRGRLRGLVVIAPATLLVPAMGLALVRVNFHLLSDSVAGALIGGGTVLGLAGLASVLIAGRAPTSA